MRHSVRSKRGFWLPVLSEKLFHRGDVIYLDGGRGWHEVMARRPEQVLVRKLPLWDVWKLHVRSWPKRAKEWLTKLVR